MLRVGLTGGIGAGKSEASRRFVACGAILVDADQAAHDVVDIGTPGLARVVDEFGPEVLKPDGGLDRERVASIVFKDADALRRLNAIIHPLVGERMAEIAAAAPADAILLYDVPLIAENNMAKGFDVVVVIDAPSEVQLDRLLHVRGMSEADARARMARQATREQRLAIADIVIDNSGSMDDLDRQVREAWADLVRRAADTR
ncbi:MAG: dephospho-CoA kinase [Actinomycetes bacterium]